MPPPGGLLERARLGTLDAGTAESLPAIRSWLPAGGARPLLDTALREARRRGPVGPLQARGLRRLHLFGTIPDGAGGPTFAASLEGERGPAAVLVLLNTGEGAKDAFLAQGEGIEDVVPGHVAESGGFDVAWPALGPALCAALADGLAAGRPPAAWAICGPGRWRRRSGWRLSIRRTSLPRSQPASGEC